VARRFDGGLRSSVLAACGLAIAIFVAGCQTVVPPAPAPVPAPALAPTPAPPATSVRPVFTPVAWTDLTGWTADTVADAWPAFVIGCRTLVADSKTRALWQTPCANGEKIDGRNSSAVREFFATNFDPYRIAATDGDDKGLVTGYYEPLLAGSRSITTQFSIPLYAPPDDLLTIDLADLYPELKDKRLRGRVAGKKVVPYWTRAELERDPVLLAGKALVYVADPVEAFFLEIQGSGRIALTDGSVIRLNYADQNGQPYRSIGRVLIDRGDLALERASMQGIAAWARANPEKLRPLLDENPSYVFFREIPPPPPDSLDAAIDGPLGTLGVALLAGRTIAVDARAVPLGAPIFLATTFPLSDKPLTRLVLAQDTGGAIRGPVRADFYWGFGSDAGREAGRMRQQGRMWLLWPKGALLP